MGKDMIIKILQDQLEASNATILRLNITIQNMQSSFDATVVDLKATIASLEALLQERDASLTKAQNQVRGLSKLTEKKCERQKPQPPAPKTEEESQAEQERKGQSGKPAATTGPGATCTSRWRPSSMTSIPPGWRAERLSAPGRSSVTG